MYFSSFVLTELMIALDMRRFLKNVYSVFRAGDNPAVGFAELADDISSTSSSSPTE